MTEAQPVDASMAVDEEMVQVLAPQGEFSQLSSQVPPSSIYFRNLLDVENTTAFCIRNRHVMTLAQQNTWTSLSPCHFYHARLVSLPGMNTCLVVGGSENIEGTKPTNKVFAISKEATVEKKPMTVPRSKVCLTVCEVRSEQNAFFNKTFAFAIGGMSKDNKTLKTVEQFNVKANVWRSLADLNVARSCASAGVLGDYLYVFGGAELETSIERFNLKASMTRVVEKFDLLEIRLPIGASEIGIVPLPNNQELMLIGGFGGAPNEKEKSLTQRLKFIAVATTTEDGSQNSTDFVMEDLSQTQNEELTMQPDFFQAGQMIIPDVSKTLIFGAQYVHAFNGSTFLASDKTHQ